MQKLQRMLLTYEKQIIEWDDARHSVLPQLAEQRLTTDEVLRITRQKLGKPGGFTLSWRRLVSPYLRRKKLSSFILRFILQNFIDN